MRWFSQLLGLAAQVPLQAPQQTMQSSVSAGETFTFKTGKDIFSPDKLVELPRPGAGVANDAGDLVFVSVSKYSFEFKENKKYLHIASVETAASPLEIPLPKGGETFWLDTYTIAYVVPGGEGKGEELYATPIVAEPAALTAPDGPILIGSFPEGAAVSNFRYSLFASRLVFSAYVYSDFNLSSVKEQDDEWENRGNTALVYDNTFVRHWDTWKGPKRSTLFSVGLRKEADNKWLLGDDYIAFLKDTGHHVPVEPFGGLEDYDISDSHAIYTAKDPELPPAMHTKQNIYIVNFMGTEKPTELTSGNQGATRNPIFTRAGDRAAWLELDKDGYESDRAKVVIYDLTRNVRYTLTQEWDRSPDSIVFSHQGYHLYMTAGEEAHVKVFKIPVPPTPAKSTTYPSFPPVFRKPFALTHKHAASAIQPMANGRLIFTQSSFTSPNDVYIMRGLRDVSADQTTTVYPEIEKITKFSEDHLKSKGLDEGESFWFEGAEGKKVQGWAFKPKGWKDGQKKKYPVLLLIHGGPQGAWEDQWSTRWNPNVFAQQGYFTIAINPTGSTTFGQEFTDAITEDWGGKPFVDLKKGWKYALNQYPEIDPERAVAAGASWGGYAINWIQGHPEYDFGFKALVCHDGVFDSNYNGYSTDELFFFNHDFGGKPWENHTRAVAAKFSPANYVHKWSTPQLLIHGSKDYRLPDTEGIGAFHALQQRGIPSRLVIFPDENHWVLNHGNSLKWHYEVFRWFDRFVGRKGDE